MDPDAIFSVFKWVIGLLLAANAAATGYLFRSVESLSGRLQEARTSIKVLESKIVIDPMEYVKQMSSLSSQVKESSDNIHNLSEQVRKLDADLKEILRSVNRRRVDSE